MGAALTQYQQWFTIASREIEQLRQELEDLEKNLNCSDATLQLRTEITNLKNKVIFKLASSNRMEGVIIFTKTYVVKIGEISICVIVGLKLTEFQGSFFEMLNI